MAGLRAARDLVDRAETSSATLTSSDLADLKAILENPELSLALDADLYETLESLVVSRGLPPREVKALLPDFARLTKPEAIAQRFMADFILLKDALIRHPGLTRPEQATRAMAFFAGYAQHLLRLVPDPAQRQALTHTFAEAFATLDFNGIVDRTTGHAGTQVAHTLLQALGPVELDLQLNRLDLDAPAWVEVPLALRAVPEPSERAQPAANEPLNQPAIERAPQPLVNDRVVLQQAPKLDRRAEVEDEHRPHLSRKGKLGPNVVWNALHRERGPDGEGEVERRDALNRLILIGALTAIFIGVVFLVVLWL